MRRPSLVLAPLALAGLLGCRSVGDFLREATRERPPAPLPAMDLASDARLDSLGRLQGSFVGEGTSRAVHLLSSDTTLIAELVRRYRPDLRRRRGEITALLAREGVVTVALRRADDATDRGPLAAAAVVGSPAGHTDVGLSTIVLRGGSGAAGCGWRGVQAELIVQNAAAAPRQPSLRGPVLGSLLTPAEEAGIVRQGFVERPALAPPSPALVHELLARTRRATDSLLGGASLSEPLDRSPELNTLADFDAADVVAFRVDADRVRYAVSLRERRLAAHADTVIASIVMVWDSAGAWRQVVFQPTLLAASRGRLASRAGPPLYWRRLQAVSDFAGPRDNLWMEQVDVRDGSVRWGIVQPRGNVVVAAADVAAGAGCGRS